MELIDDLRGIFENQNILINIINNKTKKMKKNDILLKIIKYYYVENNEEGAEVINKALEKRIRSLYLVVMKINRGFNKLISGN